MEWLAAFPDEGSIDLSKVLLNKCNHPVENHPTSDFSDGPEMYPTDYSLEPTLSINVQH